MTRRQPARGRRARADDDSGQALLLVMIVTALSMVLISTSLALSAGNVRPSRELADDLAALAAAQAGVDQFSLAVEKCGTQAAGCAAISGTTPLPIVGADGLTRGTYEWKLLTPPVVANASVVRVQVTGRVQQSVRSLVADFRTTATPLTYAYYTELETLSTQVINTYYGPRSVELPNPTTRARANLLPASPPTTVVWEGASGLDLCERPWFDTTVGPGRAQLRATRALGAGQDYTDRTTTPGSLLSVLRKASCEVYYGTGFTSTTDTPIYAKDAPLLSKSYSTGVGPNFGAEMFTDWDTTMAPAPLPPKWYRSDPILGGDPRPASLYAPKPAAVPLALPQPVGNREANATCVFTGPTRIVLQTLGTENSARVTSPGTTSLKAGCTAVQDGTLGDATLAGGLRNAKIVLGSSTVFYVKNGAAGTTAGPSNPLFNLRGPAKVTGVTGASPAEPNGFYTDMATTENAVKATVAAAPGTTSLTAVLDPWLQGLNVAQQGKKDVQYRVLAGSSVPLTGTTSTSPDALLQPSGGEVVTVERLQCASYSNRVCASWTKAAPAFTVTRPPTYTFPLTGDVTKYTTGLGTAFVQGTATKPLTIAAQDDLVLTGDIKSSGTNITGLVAGDGGVAGADVEIYHPVSCVATAPVTLPGGTCPNDITGLYSTVLPTYPALAFSDSRHPARQYANLPTCTQPVTTECPVQGLTSITIQAAVLAPKGCLCLQNFMRGPAPGATLPPMTQLTLKGAVYQAHRGALSVDYGPAVTDRSGFVSTVTYDPKVQSASPPQFAVTPTAVGSSAWQLLGIAEQQGVL